MATLLWERVSEKQGRTSLRQALLELRTAMGPLYGKVVETERERLRLKADAVWVDALAAPEGGRPDEAVPELNIFNSSLLLSGLEGLGDEFDHWLTLERQRLENRIRRLSESRVRGSLERTEADPERLALARHAVALDPTNEDAVRELMRALAGAGQRAQAIAAYEHCRALLRERLDVEPAPETQRLYGELRRKTSVVPAGPRPAPSAPHQPATAAEVREPAQPVTPAGAVLCIAPVEGAAAENQSRRATADWRELVAGVAREILPNVSGRLVEASGGELQLEFADARSAALAAFAIRARMERHSPQSEPSRAPPLRMGIEAQDAILGRGPPGNIADGARLAMTLAGAGDVIVTGRARDQLTAALDADVEDLGDRRTGATAGTVRAYRIEPPAPEHPVMPAPPLGSLVPVVAVIPPVARMSNPEHDVLGEVLADELIHALSRSERIDVISRLSTTVFRRRAATVRQVGTHLSADYVLSGVYRTSPPDVVVDFELAEVRTERVVWSERLKDKIAVVLDSEQALVNRVAADVCTAVTAQELQRLRSHPLPTLESYTLMLGAITLMHRMSGQAFQSAREMLEALVGRNPGHALPHAWTALWYALRIQQGMSDDPRADGQHAADHVKRALDADPSSSLALAMDALVQAWTAKRLDIALDRCERSVLSNRSHSMAWLVKGIVHAFGGEGELAVESAGRALKLSPLDPHGFFYRSLAATAHLSARQYREALMLAQSSLRANRKHASTLRAMAIAQWQLGQADAARKTVDELLRLEPAFTISRYLARSPAEPYWTGKEWSAALRGAGVPE